MCRELITVVTISFNAGSSIRKTMESVLAQTYRPLEYIIVDGGSSDNTMEIVKELEPDFRNRGVAFRSLSEKDKGIYDAMNKGIQLASGRWINFMNSGDVFCNKDVISGLFSFDLCADVKLLYGDTLRVKSYAVVPSKGSIPEVTPLRMPACHQAMFADVAEMKKNLFDLSYHLAADYHFVYNLYRRGARLQYIPMDVALCEAVDGVSSVYKLEVKSECARIRGIDKTFKWRLFFLRKKISFRVQKAIEKLIPSRYLLEVKKANRKRLEARTRSMHAHR